MVKRSVSMLRSSLLFLVTAWASVAGAAPRQPTAKWEVRFDDAQCLALRNYGSAEEPHYLLLKAPAIGSVTQVAVLRKGGGTSADQVDATISVGPSAPLRTNMLMFTPKNSKLRMYSLNMKATDFARLREAKEVAIRSSGLNETFILSQVQPLMKVMDECVADLRRVWNVSDPEGEQSQLAKRATANLARLVSDQDYPNVAVLQNASGSVKFVLLVDEAGRVADCTVTETSGVAALDSQTCAIIRERAKFKPARGPDGKLAKDALTSRITWKMY